MKASKSANTFLAGFVTVWQRGRIRYTNQDISNLVSMGRQVDVRQAAIKQLRREAVKYAADNQLNWKPIYKAMKAAYKGQTN